MGVSSDTIRTLEERNWVAQIGHRDVPGRPALFGTTQGFLEYFNMTSLRELPELMDKRELGEIAKDMNLTLPMDGVQDDDEAAKRKEELSEANEDQQSDVATQDSSELEAANADNGGDSAVLEKSDTDGQVANTQLGDNEGGSDASQEVRTPDE